MKTVFLVLYLWGAEVSYLSKFGDFLTRYNVARLLYRETELDESTAVVVAAWLRACGKQVATWGDSYEARRVLDEHNLPAASWTTEPARGQLYLWRRWPVLLSYASKDNGNGRSFTMMRTLVGGPTQEEVVRAAYTWQALTPARGSSRSSG